MKHTPAPWNIKKGEYNYDVRDEYNVPICYNATKTNAKLIAAAPELLEACKMMLEIIEAETLDEKYDGETECLRDIIRRAEGK